MNKVHASCLGAFLALASGTASAALDRTGDFALLDSDGEFHQLSRYQHRKAVVLMSYAQSCSGMDASLARYQELHSRYAEQGIEFLLLDSHDLDRAALRELNMPLPILQDNGQLISEALGITQAGDVRVLNPDRLSMFYVGAVGDELDSSLSGLLTKNLRDTVKTDNTSGCAIDYPVRDRHAADVPDYVTEIAPIIIDNCASCHRQFGVGPFAIDKYVSLLGWSPMIREVLLNKRMPPAQIDPSIGHSPNARYVATEDIQTLLHWFNAGAPRGEGADPLEALKWVESKEWILGEPDMVVSAPPLRIPPAGILDYVYADVELPFTEDKWVTAVQYMPDATSALHHLMGFVTAPDEDFWGEERNSNTSTRTFLDSYAPGKPSATTFTEGTAVLIPKGHKLSLQFHFVGIGAELQDATKIGLYFSDSPNGEGLKERLVQAVSAQLVLPANEHEIPAHAEYVFDESVVITGVRAKMNARGKKMRFSIELPDGTLRDLLSVPAYNYGWQPHYVLDEPVTIPAGTKVHVSGAFDNSISNPFNPDPDIEVRTGLNSTDEMFTGYFTYHKAD
jgi:peroxiredoxin